MLFPTHICSENELAQKHRYPVNLDLPVAHRALPSLALKDPLATLCLQVIDCFNRRISSSCLATHTNLRESSTPKLVYGRSRFSSWGREIAGPAQRTIPMSYQRHCCEKTMTREPACFLQWRFCHKLQAPKSQHVFQEVFQAGLLQNSSIFIMVWSDHRPYTMLLTKTKLANSSTQNAGITYPPPHWDDENISHVLLVDHSIISRTLARPSRYLNNKVLTILIRVFL